jgi:hypothetical protein
MHSHRQAHLRYFDRDVHPWPFIRASSSSSLASSPGQDSSDNYPDIGASACENSAEDNRLILMVAPNRDRSRNSSSEYPTIGRSEASDAQTRSAGLVQNLIPDFNAVRVQAIHGDYPAYSTRWFSSCTYGSARAEAANLVIAEKSAS